MSDLHTGGLRYCAKCVCAEFKVQCSKCHDVLTVQIMLDVFFSTDYGFFKLEAKTKTDSGVAFTTSGNSSSDTGKVSGNLETKYKCSDYGEFV